MKVTCEGCSGDGPPTAGRAAATTESTVVYRIDKMDCPTEERLIRDKLAGLAGIGAMEFNLVQRTLTLSHAPEALEIAPR